jgi:hypothetical protein
MTLVFFVQIAHFKSELETFDLNRDKFSPLKNRQLQQQAMNAVTADVGRNLALL